MLELFYQGAYQKAEAQAEPVLVLQGIEVDPVVALKLSNSIQEYQYQQGFLTLYSLEPHSRTQGYYRLSQHPCSRPCDTATATVQTPDGIYPFVILETTHGLDLRIGLGGHYHTADKAACVLAAGDLYFKGGFLDKITNQSGSYHLGTQENSEARRRKHQNSLDAMQAVGLPMQQFHNFEAATVKPLLFGFQSKSDVCRSSTVTSSERCNSPAGSPSLPCTGAAPRVRQPAL